MRVEAELPVVTMPTIPTVFDKRACSFGEWYPRFRQHTWSSVVIPLAPAFIRYLDQDSVIIPESSAPPRPQRRSSEDSDGFSEDEDEELAASQLDVSRRTAALSTAGYN